MLQHGHAAIGDGAVQKVLWHGRRGVLKEPVQSNLGEERGFDSVQVAELVHCQSHENVDLLSFGFGRGGGGVGGGGGRSEELVLVQPLNYGGGGLVQWGVDAALASFLPRVGSVEGTAAFK